MIEIIGNIWDQRYCDIICVTTNGIVKADGRAVMGKGIALEAKERYPDIDLELGKKLKTCGNVVSELYWDSERNQTIVSFPTKHHWKDNSDIDLIEQSAIDLKLMAMNFVVKGPDYCPIVALPRPGCGNGGLDWKDVKEILSRILISDRFLIFSNQ